MILLINLRRIIHITKYQLEKLKKFFVKVTLSLSLSFFQIWKIDLQEKKIPRQVHFLIHYLLALPRHFRLHLNHTDRVVLSVSFLAQVVDK